MLYDLDDVATRAVNSLAGHAAALDLPMIWMSKIGVPVLVLAAAGPMVARAATPTQSACSPRGRLLLPRRPGAQPNHSALRASDAAIRRRRHASSDRSECGPFFPVRSRNGDIRDRGGFSCARRAPTRALVLGGCGADDLFARLSRHPLCRRRAWWSSHRNCRRGACSRALRRGNAGRQADDKFSVSDQPQNIYPLCK